MHAAKPYSAMIAVSVVLLLQAAAVGQRDQPQAKEEIQLVTGLDGGTYEAYLPRVIEEVQSALQAKGLYSGPVDGVLNHETMEAIGNFQRQNGIMLSGVPSPDTRKALLGENGETGTSSNHR